MRINSFPPISVNNASILILGTMPGKDSLKLNQYYGNSRNAFWKILFMLFKENYSNDYEKKTSLLKKNKIALWDVLQSCERESSLDTDITGQTTNDINTFLQEYPSIKSIVFNGKNAMQYYKDYIGLNSNLKYYVLPSTSPANVTKSFDNKLKEWMVVKELL